MVAGGEMGQKNGIVTDPLSILYNLKFNNSIIPQTTMKKLFTISDYAKVFRGGDFSPLE